MANAMKNEKMGKVSGVVRKKRLSEKNKAWSLSQAGSKEEVEMNKVRQKGTCSKK